MEVRKGYKKSDVGIIPSDWEAKRLGDLGYFKNGINKSNEDFGHGFPFANLMDVFGKSSIYSNDAFGLINSNDIEQKSYNLLTGDVLFIRSSVKPSGVGLTCVVENDLPRTVFSGFIIRFRDKGMLSKEFKRHCFYSENFRNSLIGSSTVSANTNTNQNSLRELLIPVPPTLQEQTAIATVLSDTDALITSVERLIAKKRSIKQGAMQELLSSKEGWELKRLGDLVSVYSGGTPNTNNLNYYGGDIPWITSGDLNKDMIYSVEGRITKQGLENSSAKMVSENTLLIALYGATAGVTAITKIRAAINQAVLAIMPKHADINFLYYKISWLKEWIIKTYTQGGQPNLSGNIIKSIELALPNDVTEQKRISNILLEMDAEITTLELKLEKSRQIKSGMMQDLLTGKIRLV